MPLTRYLFLLLTLLASPVFAEIDVRDADRDMYPTDINYDPAIPTPASILGHELGAEPVRHHKLVEYITKVAEASPRLSVGSHRPYARAPAPYSLSSRRLKKTAHGWTKLRHNTSH